MDGFVELTPEQVKSSQGIADLNRMLQILFDCSPGDSNNVRDFYGYGSPEGVISASIGSNYRRLDGGISSTLYVKTSGNGATGWTTISTGSAAGTVTDVSVVTANGLSGTVANPTTSPAITINVEKTLLTSKTLVTPATDDVLLIGDTSDSDNLKKITVESISDKPVPYFLQAGKTFSIDGNIQALFTIPIEQEDETCDIEIDGILVEV